MNSAAGTLVEVEKCFGKLVAVHKNFVVETLVAIQMIVVMVVEDRRNFVVVGNMSSKGEVEVDQMSFAETLVVVRKKSVVVEALVVDP
jgi:hypothetical protein